MYNQTKSSDSERKRKIDQVIVSLTIYFLFFLFFLLFFSYEKEYTIRIIIIIIIITRDTHRE